MRFGNRWRHFVTIKSWLSKQTRKFNVSWAIWTRQRQRSGQYPSELKHRHISDPGMSRKRSTSAVSCIGSSEWILPMCLVSARLQPKPSYARSAQMCPGFEMLPPSRPGWDCKPSGSAHFGLRITFGLIAKVSLGLPLAAAGCTHRTQPASARISNAARTFSAVSRPVQQLR